MDGIAGVVLGGSRARDAHSPDSDIDLGLYYRASLDTDALAALAREVAGPDARVTAPGDWGPWVDGGGWLNLGGTAMDWIYRDLGRVRAAWSDALRGHYEFHAQVGHPLGVPDFAYAGELALGVVLSDPTGELADLQGRTVHFPPLLAEALVSGLWEAQFVVSLAAKGAGRADTAYVAGCLFRAVLLCAHALHGRAGRWLVNEKGAIGSTAQLTIAPPHFGDRAARLLAHLGQTPHQLAAAVSAADDLVADTISACAGSAPDRR